jgi:hypothetical protein
MHKALYVRMSPSGDAKNAVLHQTSYFVQPFDTYLPRSQVLLLDLELSYCYN